MTRGIFPSGEIPYPFPRRLSTRLREGEIERNVRSDRVPHGSACFPGRRLRQEGGPKKRARLEEGFADRTLRPVGASGPGGVVASWSGGSRALRRESATREDSFRKKKLTHPRTLPLRQGGEKNIPDLKSRTLKKKEGFRSGRRTSTTLSSGSLGSRVDEERSQLRDLV